MIQSEAGKRTAHLQGAGWMLLSGLMFVFVAILIRQLDPRIPAEQAAFIRYLFALLLLSPSLFRMRWSLIEKDTLGWYLIRGIFHALAVILWFYAMAHIPIAEVTAIGYTTPIYTAIGAVLLFGESFRWRRVIAVLAGFVGALIILRPGFQSIAPGSIAQLIAAACFAVSYLITKRLTRSASSIDITVMLTIACTLVMAPLALMNWHPPGWMDFIWLLAISVLATTGHYAVTRAISLAPLTVIQPVTFIQLIWAVFFGYLLFDETPDSWVIAGAVMIVTSVSYMAHREMVIGRRQSAAMQGKEAG